MIASRSSEGTAQPGEGCLRTGPTLHGARRARPDPLDHRFPTPLVGRSSEFAVLRAAWWAATAGTAPRTTAVLIRGEPGIGKSRLGGRNIAGGRDQRAVVVELAGSPFHVGAGFHPIQVLLEARCGIDGDADGPERLHRLRDELGASGADPDGRCRCSPRSSASRRAPVTSRSPPRDASSTTRSRRRITTTFSHASAVARACSSSRTSSGSTSRRRASSPGAHVRPRPAPRRAHLARRTPRFAVETVIELQPADRRRVPRVRRRVAAAGGCPPPSGRPSPNAATASRSTRGARPRSGARRRTRVPPRGERSRTLLYEPLVARLLSPRAASRSRARRPRSDGTSTASCWRGARGPVSERARRGAWTRCCGRDPRAREDATARRTASGTSCSASVAYELQPAGAATASARTRRRPPRPAPTRDDLVDWTGRRRALRARAATRPRPRPRTPTPPIAPRRRGAVARGARRSSVGASS